MTATNDNAAILERLRTAEAAPARGRLGPGEDPDKRRQILDGANRVFSIQGFDASSMNDVAREANVSKGTLYVYFRNKEELFSALVDEKRARHSQEIREMVETIADLETALSTLGRKIVCLLTQDWAIRANRIVLGIAERMPDLGRAFFEGGPGRGALMLQAFLDQRVAAGELAIDDTYLAAVQFLELCGATLVRPRLFGKIEKPPTDEEINRVVDSAVRLFLAGYRA